MVGNSDRAGELKPRAVQSVSAPSTKGTQAHLSGQGNMHSQPFVQERVFAILERDCR